MPVCSTYIESMLINFTQMSLCNIFAIQAILYLFKRDVAEWKRLGYPERMLQTWCQIVATPHMGFRLLSMVSATETIFFFYLIVLFARILA